MIPIICVDDRWGMLFNHRRVSRDEKLYEKILNRSEGRPIWMSKYSAELFPDTAQICVDEEFLKKAKEGDYCFVEKEDIANFMEQVESILFCHWNRNYPCDKSFDRSILQKGWTHTIKEEFQGKSHEKITIEEWKRI